MNKDQIIAFIEGQIATGKISKNDLLTIAGVQEPATQASSKAPVVASKEDSSKKLTNVLYTIGAIIAIIGVAILVAQNWNEIGFGGRILVTLGISLVTYVVGLVMRNPEQKMLSQVMFMISAVLAPFGVYVLLNEASVDFSITTQLMTAIVLTIIYGVAYFITRRNILTIITVGFATWAYYTFIFKIFESTRFDEDILQWTTMLLGAAYLCIAYGFGAVLKSSDDEQDEKENYAVQNVFYGLGTLAILGAGITIGGFFDLVLILLIFGAFYGGVFLKSRAMLTIGALFLMAHIIKLTSEYFVDSIGWPVALIAVGFLVIGVGYMTFYLNKKFISGK